MKPVTMTAAVAADPTPGRREIRWLRTVRWGGGRRAVHVAEDRRSRSRSGAPVRAPRSSREPPLLRPLPARTPRLPSRYRVREENGERVLRCVEAPTLTLRARRGLSFTPSAARSHPPGAIFLDGAAQGEPFLDPVRALYNLDHHEGCVRAFTLATCEQALVVIRKWLDLRKRDFIVYANDADLDTVLAIWILMNHLRLNEEKSRSRTAILPLLRLEGCIDAHGLELEDLCALPPRALTRARDWMKRLRERELLLKKRGRWERIDLLDYVAERLRALDALVYSPEDFDTLDEAEELARVELPGGSLAVVCRSRLGIYELEKQLRRFHGDRLGVLVLQKDTATYSVRKVDPTLPVGLEDIYAWLNLLDPASGGSRAPDRWGGSAEIGGSPRKAGTRMTPQQIADACRDAHSKPPLLRLVGAVSKATLTAGSLLLAAFSPLLVPGYVHGPLVAEGLPVGTLLAGIGAGLLLLAGRRTPGIFGLRRPRGLDWWRLLPLALLGGLAGGVWIPALGPGGDPTSLGTGLGLAGFLIAPAAAEFLFRGAVQGSLATSLPSKGGKGLWSLSLPVLLSSGLYTIWAAVLPLAMPGHGPTPLRSPGWAVGLAGALLFGIASGMARERSGSLLAPVVLHWIAAAAVLGATLALPLLG